MFTYLYEGYSGLIEIPSTKHHEVIELCFNNITINNAKEI